MRSKRLREVIEGLGMSNVQTVITTGNVVFDSPSRSARSLEARIESAWPESLGFHSTTIIRSHRQITDLVACDPFAGLEDTPTTRFQTTFLKHPVPTDADIPFTTLPYTADNGAFTFVAIGDRVVCSTVDSTSPRAPDLTRTLERAYGKDITTRTWKTVHRIVRKLA